MPDIVFDIDEKYNPMEELHRASGKDKKRMTELYRELGYLKPDPNRGIFKEIGHTVMDTGNQLGLGFGRTIEELSGSPRMREKFEHDIELNPQYGPDEFYSPSSLKPSHIARTVTTGAVQSLGAIEAGLAGNLIGGPAGGLAAMGGFTFGQIYGDTVKDYRAAMPHEDESVVKGLAFTSAVGQSLIESILGPEKVIAGIGKGFFAETMKNTTRSLVKRMGAEALKGAISEGSEEVLQAYWDSLCKGVAAKEGLQLPGWEEVRDQFMGGALPGAVLGGIGGVKEHMADAKSPSSPSGENIEGAAPTGADIPVSEETMIRSGQTAGEALLDELGIKHSRMTEEEQQTEGIGYVVRDGKRLDANGLFDRRTNEIKINPSNVGEMFVHGHELDHWLELNHKDLADQLHSVMDAELNEAGLADDESPVERRADMLGHILNDPKALQKTIEAAGKQDAAFGEKFLNAVIEFSKQVMAYMKAHAHLPGAEQYFNDYKRVRDTAAKILAEVKKRSQAEAERIKAETPEAEAPAEPAGSSTSPGNPRSPSSPSSPSSPYESAESVHTLRTPDGSMAVKTRFKVIPIEAAVHSDKAEYDQKLQPRNRDTKSSEAQINKMAGEIHPDMLLDSKTTDMGAPIVDSKNQVISGNGRVMALLRARGQNIQDYYAAVRKFAAENGIEIPEGLKNPLLVREVGEDADPVKLAELSNRDNKLKRTDAEQAEADAKMIMDGDLLDIFNPSDDGAVLTAQNMDFVRQFIVGTGDDSLRTSSGEAAAGAEGRIKRAVLAALFNEQKDARSLIQKLIENATEEGLKRQVDGVSSAAGRIMKAAGREGYAGYDLRQELADAFRALLEYKRELQLNPKRYNGIDDYLDQGDMFGRQRSPEAELLARFLGNAKSIKSVRDALNAYADAVERIDVHTDDMFGAKDEGKESLLKRVLGVNAHPEAPPAAPPSAKSSVKSVPSVPSVNREKQDSGRFNQNSDTPLLSAEEDAGDFQLFAETPKDAQKRDLAAEKAEADKLEHAREEARRNAPDLPMGTTDHADNTESPQSEVPVMTEDEFLAQRGLSMPVSDYMIDKQKIPHGETEAQRKQRIREADRIANEYAEARKKAKAEYRAKVENGEIRKPSAIEKLEKIAAGNPDNESVKAAKRALEKRKKRAEATANPNGENNPDIQYSIVGEKGMENLSRESKEGLRRLENLQLAKSLLKAGAKMDAVKFQTGWELGKDGKWRTELPDLKVKRKGVLPDGTEYEKNDVDYVTSGKLGEYVDAPEIFKAYPQLKNMPLTVSFHKGRTYGECIEKHFNLSTGEVSWPEIAIHLDEDLDVDVKEIEGLLIHEVQHAIQDIEGFSRGSNPKYFKDHPVKNPNRPEELEQAKQTLEKLKKQFPDQNTLKKADLWYETDIAFEHPLEYIQKGMDAIEDFFEQQGLSDLFNDYIEQRHHVRVLEGLEELSPYTAYFRTAGEVESRNAERRSKMPLEQRLRKLLASTEDVAEKDKIYLENAAVEALMSIDENGNYFPGPDEWGTAYTSMTGKGRAAIDFLLEKQEGFVPGAFQRNDIGDIDLVYGKTGQGAKDKGGYGLAHILKRHPGMNWDLFSQLIETGTVQPINQRRINIVDGNAKTIIQLEWRGQKRNWVVSAMGGDLTSTADSLLANDPQGAAKQGIAPKGIVTIGDVWEKASRDLKKTQKNSSSDQSDTSDQSDQSEENTEPYVQHSLVKDPGLLKKLDAEEKRGEYLTLYRAAQLRDGKLYSPMAAKINGQWPEPIQLGQWEQADEHPELIVKGNKFTLNKGNGATIDARYNPYIHSSPSPLNDQFSSAYKRPELVTLEVRVPKSELTSGYHAEHAKDSVGMQEWKAGTVSQKLSGRRQVMLSRYDKPIRIVPDSEVARKIAEMLDGKDITIPANVVTPSLRAELEKAGVKVDDGEKDYSLRKHKQVNPIVVNGQVQAEYADLLENKDFTPETIPEWDQKAIAWIDRQGGIEPAAEMIANDTEHSDRHVATLVRRHVLNSEFASSLPDDIRMAVELKNIDEGTAWGREGAARRLAALTLKSIDTVKALFRKLHEKMPDKEKVKLRNKILEQTGVDINNLPDDLVNDKSKLDKVLRAELANTSSKLDKAYEYWINAILSAPTTHSANIIGNTANALYELGPKRFAEAAVNALAKRKDAATFGEFREMWNALDFRSAWKKAKTAFDLETLTPGGKFRENAAVAIPGKLGRAVRTPGRLLIMADAFARELLIPAETAARAYREAKNQGLTGDKMRSYIQQQISNPGSTAYQAGKASAERIIFQEDPGAVLQRLIQLKASDGPGAQILKYLLPFVKTPGNILKQGIRKSPLGSLNLAWETVQAVRGKRAFDSEYLGHAAEQLIAWAAFLALGGFGDDDDDARPFLTGSSAPAGSGENKFKANTVPPYSIRIGDTYYSYRRIEPLATGLAIIADAHQAIREVRNGKETARALNDMLRKTGKMISEKSYLDSINQAVRFLEDPDRSLATFGTNFIASWVPNGMRAALNAGRDEVGDPKSRERGEEFLQDQFQVITSRMGFTSRAPKLDLFGHPITKEQQEDSDVTDFLLRLFVPVNRTAIDEDHPGKRLLLNYNATHPESQWWGSIPNYRFSRNKEKYYFDNETYHQFAAEAGKLAEKQIYNAVRHGVIHPDNPSEKDIEIMKKIFTRARKETRQKFFKRAKKW